MNSGSKIHAHDCFDQNAPHSSDDETKSLADDALKAMGLTMSEAVRLFLHQIVVDQALPFAIKVPNDKTRQAMKEANTIVVNRQTRFDSAEQLFDDLEKNGQ